MSNITTNNDDLALVCSNCHRMLHRRIKQNEYYNLTATNTYKELTNEFRANLTKSFKENLG